MGAPSLDVSPRVLVWQTTGPAAWARRELDAVEAQRLVDVAASLGAAFLVLAEVGPETRGDLESLVMRAKAAGRIVHIRAAAGAGPMRERLVALRAAGADRVSFELDSPDAERHDALRGPGSFDRTLQGVLWSRAIGLPVELRTRVSDANASELETMLALVQRIGAVSWDLVFFDGAPGAERLSDARLEPVLARLLPAVAAVPFAVQFREAPQVMRLLAAQGSVPPGVPWAAGLLAAPRPLNAGRGVAYVDRFAEVYPSETLPVRVGSLRVFPLELLYRFAPVFTALRDPDRLQGKCRACEFRGVCGGSRARAWAATGDWLAADPACSYVPRAYNGKR